MDKQKIIDIEELDSEWIDLILYALEMGLSPEKVREFLNDMKKNIILLE
ncbi:anti-repressor SinI family protein [Niallia sp. 01092]